MGRLSRIICVGPKYNPVSYESEAEWDFRRESNVTKSENGIVQPTSQGNVDSQPQEAERSREQILP